MNLSPHSLRRAFRFLAGCCGLLLYAGAYSPLGLEIAALVGSFDRDHHAAFRGGVEGIQLVLRHSPGCASHQHGVAARALALFAQPASATEPDHVLQFGAADGFARQAQLIAPTSESFAQPDFAFRETSWLLRANLFFHPRRLIHRLETTGNWFACVRRCF